MTEHEHPQVTRVSLEIWMHDPTTQKYLQCLAWYVEQSVEHMGNGGCVKDTAEQTYRASSVNLAVREALTGCQDVEDILNGHDMLEAVEVTEDGA